METIIKNDNLGYYINQLTMEGYKYIIKAKDKFLSNWGESENKSHIQLIACKDEFELITILEDVRKDNGFSYVNWYKIPYENDKIIKLSYKYHYTIRNDWTRCF